MTDFEADEGLRLGGDLYAPGVEKAFCLSALTRDLDGKVWGVVPRHPLTHDDRGHAALPIFLPDRKTVIGRYDAFKARPEDTFTPHFVLHSLLTRFEVDPGALESAGLGAFWPQACANPLDSLGKPVMTSEAFIEAEGQGEYAQTAGTVIAVSGFVRLNGQLLGGVIETMLDPSVESDRRPGQPYLSETGELLGAALATVGQTKFIAPLNDYLIDNHLSLYLPRRDTKGLIKAALTDMEGFDLLPNEADRRAMEMAWS